MLLHECGELAEVGADQWLAVRSDLSCEFGSAAQMYSAGENVQWGRFAGATGAQDGYALPRLAIAVHTGQNLLGTAR